MEYLVALGIAFLAALAAGLVNTVAGGGTLVSFPVLVAPGLLPHSAIVTTALALCPGYLGGLWAQRRDLRGQKRRLTALVPLSVAGGIAGGLLLIRTGEASFTLLVPYLILFASFLLAAQTPVRRWLRSGTGGAGPGIAGRAGALVLLFLTAA